MRSTPTRRSLLRASSCAVVPLGALAALGLAATAVAQVPLPPQNPIPLVPLDPAPNAKFRTWFYGEAGNLVWDRHQFYEDNANTVFSLAHDFVAGLPGQVGSYPDVLLLNYAQFEPPEGEPAATRHLAIDSIRKRGLQLWVNYSDAVIDASAGSSTFRPGSFFISMSLPINTQTIPQVPEVGFIGHSISATRAELGRYGIPPPPVPNAIYITASIGYAKNDIVPAEHGLVDEAWADRLLVWDPALQQWADQSSRVPASARLGNSSGVAFADFNGDGYDDLYVGQCGDNWNGEKNVLCIFNPVTGNFRDETAGRIPGEYMGATNDVAAGDLDADGDLDIVVANRMKRGGPAGPESLDYVLINDDGGIGVGYFGIRMLDPTSFSDTRSVAIGDIDHVVGDDRGLEIVLGNAGSEGHLTDLEIPASQNHTMEIFRDVLAGPGLTYGNRTLTEFLTANEELRRTSPRTLQVILKDVVRPQGGGFSRWTRDGWVDLVIVNHRESLKNQITLSSGPTEVPHNVQVFQNAAAPPVGSGRWFTPSTAFPTLWGQTVAIADFIKDTAPEAPEDFFVGCGNRFSGAHSSVSWNRGSATPGTEPPWGDLNGTYDLWPGTEHGYGFDFADWNGNGTMDAVQTARTYDYLVKDLDEASGHVHPHLEIAENGSQPTSNKRGRLNPQGMEDGCFADFDRDGDLDAIMASQRLASSSMPTGYLPKNRQSAETIVLENTSGQSLAHDASFETLNDGMTQVLLDDKIDLNLRNGSRYPVIADRVVCGDMDNDGDVDAIVHLFGLLEPVTPGVGPDFMARIEAPEFGELPSSPGRYSLGWRYLENIIGEPMTPAGIWFKDVAASSMKNSLNRYDRAWNRGLGSDVLGDFDNNGALDLYTTSGRALYAANGPNGALQPPDKHQVEDIRQTDDLLFMNGRGTAIGVLVETATLLPPRALDEISAQPKDSAGSFCVTQGDVDNDGAADVVVMHTDFGKRTTLPWLLMNRINVSGVGVFQNEFEARMDWQTLSPLIHTTAATATNGQALYPSTQHPDVYCDATAFCSLLDWDGDGDLDLVYVVERDLPRFWRNKGADTNGDGAIDVQDTSPRGFFEDVTDTILQHYKTSLDVNDMAVVDLDGDGDLDFAVDPFSDGVILWRNDQVLGIRPRVAEIWPRVGTKRGGIITLEGANLTGLDQVELRITVNGVVQTTLITSGITVLSDRRATVQLPTTSSPTLTNWGLAQVRVRRQAGGDAWWSRQYAGYFILQ